MDRECIKELARLLGSKIENTGAANVRLQCPMAPFTHKRGTDENPAWSILVDLHTSSKTKCWACDETGTVVEVLERAAERGAVGLEEAIAFARENDGGGIAGAFTALALHRRDREVKRRSGFDVEKYVACCARMTSQYVVDRGLLAADIRRWRVGYDEGPTQVGYATVHHRVVFPVWNETGALIGATMRTVLDDGIDPPKYRDTPMLPKGDLFYGEHNIDRTRGTVHIVEGILDAIVAGRYLPNVVAILGANTGMGPIRVAKLRRWCNRVVLLLDADKAGSEAVEGKWHEFKGKDGRMYRKYTPGLLALLRPYFVVLVATLPTGKDPADVGPDVVEYVKRARYLEK